MIYRTITCFSFKWGDWATLRLKLRPHQTPRGAAPKKTVGAASTNASPLFLIAGATLQAAPRRDAPRNVSWEKFIFYGAAFFGVTLTRSLSFFTAQRGAAFGGAAPLGTMRRTCLRQTVFCDSLQMFNIRNTAFAHRGWLYHWS